MNEYYGYNKYAFDWSNNKKKPAVKDPYKKGISRADKKRLKR